MDNYWYRLGIGEDVDTSVLEFSKALAYLRPDLWDEGLAVIRAVLRETANDNDKVRRFYDYVERYWYPLRDVVSLWGSPICTNNLESSFEAAFNRQYNRLYERSSDDSESDTSVNSHQTTMSSSKSDCNIPTPFSYRRLTFNRRLRHTSASSDLQKNEAESMDFFFVF